MLIGVATIPKGRYTARLYNLSQSVKQIYKGSSVGELLPLVENNDTHTENCYSISTHIVETKKKPRIGELRSVMTETENLDLFRNHFPLRNDSLSAREEESVYDLLARRTAIISGNKSALGEARDIYGENTDIIRVRSMVPPQQTTQMMRGHRQS